MVLKEIALWERKRVLWRVPCVTMQDLWLEKGISDWRRNSYVVICKYVWICLWACRWAERVLVWLEVWVNVYGYKYVLYFWVHVVAYACALVCGWVNMCLGACGCECGWMSGCRCVWVCVDVHLYSYKRYSGGRWKQKCLHNNKKNPFSQWISRYLVGKHQTSINFSEICT